MNEPSERREVGRTAKQEADKMLRAAEGVQPDALVSMSIADFKRLAMLLQKSSDAAVSCENCDCFGRQIGGFRFWVPLPQVEKEREAMESLRAENIELVRRSERLTSGGYAPFKPIGIREVAGHS